MTHCTIFILSTPGFSIILHDQAIWKMNPNPTLSFGKDIPTPRGDVMHARDVCRNLPKYGVGDGGDGWYFSWLKKYPHQNGWKVFSIFDGENWKKHFETTMMKRVSQEVKRCHGNCEMVWTLDLVVSHKGFLSLCGLLSGGVLLATTLHASYFVAPNKKDTSHFGCIPLDLHLSETKSVVVSSPLKCVMVKGTWPS